MPERPAVYEDPRPALARLSPLERKQHLWRSGELRWLLLPHQRPEYEGVRKWHDQLIYEGEHQLRLKLGIDDPDYEPTEYKQLVARTGANYANMWMTEWGRRTGKSAFWLTYMIEHAIRFFNQTGEQYRGMFCIAEKVHINDILVPLARKIFNPDLTGCPEGYEPEYRGSKGGLHEGFHIPAIGAYIKLVGLDRDPQSTRGQWLDGCAVTEAAFVDSDALFDAITSAIQPQVLGRPWGWLALESSTAKQKDHKFNTEFREDCRLRGCYSRKTVDDNTSISDEEKEEALRKSGGRHSPQVRREYFCEEVRDESTLIIPEFSEEHHCVAPEDWSKPLYAHAYVGMDPGVGDNCGLVWLYVDYRRQQIVIEASYAAPNRSSPEIAQVIRDTEYELWGSKTRERPIVAPHEPSIDDLVREPLHRDPDQEPAHKRWLPGYDRDGQALKAPDGSCTYWKTDDLGGGLQPNPLLRVSDTDKLMRLNLARHYNIEFEAAKKGTGSAEYHRQTLRRLFKDGKIRIVKNGRTQKLIEHLRSGELDPDTGKWKRTPSLGHSDCVAALMYVVDRVDFNKDPEPPKVVNPYNPYVLVPRKWAEEKHRKTNKLIGRLSGNKYETKGPMKYLQTSRKR